MLHIHSLDFDFQDKPLLSQVQCHLPEGGLLHVQGGNGLGKTTLLKLIAGLYTPQAGSVCFRGRDIKEQLPYYRSQLCYVGDQPGIHPQLSLRENLRYDRHYLPKYHNLEAIAAIFSLQRLMDIPCGQLSAGQQRQVGLLRLWMTKASLWLLDEPLVALDAKSQGILTTHLQQHRDQGGGIVLTSHQPLPPGDYQVLKL